MAKCIRCEKKGFTLKVDQNGLCADCQAQDAQAAELARRQAAEHLAQLQAFHDEYVVIPDAREAADGILAEAKASAEKIVQDASDAASQCVSLAQQNADNLVAQAKAKEEAAEEKVRQLHKAAAGALGEAKKAMEGLLQGSAKDFAAMTDKLFEKLPK
ncbi:MAG: hypothetical protein RSJ41_04015 [Clostridia bacterium]